MGHVNTNRVTLSGNLTKDPELRAIASGTSVTNLRVACNTRRKDGATGEWTDKPNYFDVVVWGRQAEAVCNHLRRGSPVMVDGELEWREWEKDGVKRQAVQIIANPGGVEFLRTGGGGGEQSAQSGGDPRFNAPAGDDRYGAAAGGSYTQSAGSSKPDDDIPF